jgi:predicted PurR-regulated permease PerM
MTSERDQRRLILWAITMSLAGIVMLWVLFLIRNVLLLLYVSIILAIGFSPAVRWIERQRVGIGRRRFPRWAAILLLYVGFLGSAAIILTIVIPPLVGQLTELGQQMPTYVDQLQNKLVRARLIEHRYTWSQLLQKVESPGLAFTGILGAVQSVVGAFAAVITVLILPYYLLLEASSLQGALLQVVSPDNRASVARVTRDVTLKVGAWLNGQILLCAVIGLTATVGLWIIGVPFPYVLGLIAGLGEFIPIVGPISAAVPAVLMGWTVSFKTAIFVAIYFAVQQFVENNFLVPRIMERQVGVSAVTILIALLIGGELLGIVGAVLAVPTAAIVQVLLQEFFAREHG